MTRSRGRPSTYNKRPANLNRHTCDMALNIVARKVEVEKANNGGVVKYKAMTDIVERWMGNLTYARHISYNYRESKSIVQPQELYN
jgi:hypothetical protein